MFVFINAYLEHVFVKRRLVFNTSNSTYSVLHLFYRISFSDVFDLLLYTRILVVVLNFSGISERVFSIRYDFPTKRLLVVGMKRRVEDRKVCHLLKLGNILGAIFLVLKRKN